MLTGLNFPISADNRTRRAFNAVTDDLRGVRGMLAGVNDYARRTGRAMRNIGAGLAAGVTAPIALAGRQAVQLYDAQLRAERQVQQAILSTGGAAGLSAEQLFDMASGLQAVTTFGDEDILQNITAPLLTFTNVADAEFGRAQAAILDMSALLGTDLQSATMQVGRALNDPLAGISALGRAGVQFSDEQRALIEGFVEVNDLASAQAVILGELETQFGGQAEALRDLPLGQWAALSNSIGDVQESLGEQIVPFLVPLVGHVERAVAWFADLSPEVRRTIVVVGGLAAAVGPLTAGLGIMIMGMTALASPIGLVIFGLGAAAGAAAYLWSQWDELKDRFPILERLENLGGTLAEAWSDLPALRWAVLIPLLRWARFIPGLRWAAFIPTLAWGALGVIGRIGWVALAGALSWGSLIARLAWGALGFIGPIGWVALAGSLAWGVLVDEISWDGWIPRVEWADWITRIDWSDWIPEVNWASIFRPGDVAREQAAAAQAGAAIGSDLAAGMTLGIASGRGETEAATRDYLQSLEDAARDQSETRSPSRVWMRIGQDLANGLGLGIDQAAPQAVSAAQGMASDVTDAASDAVSGLGQFSSGFASFLGPVLRGTQSIGDAFRAMGQRIADSLIDTGLQGIGGWIGDVLGLGGGGNRQGGLGGLLGGLLPFADGGVLSGGRVQAFANGGVVNGPTMFPMRGGAGLMGEAGPEAILPLARGSNGALGVQIAQAASQAADATVRLIVEAQEGPMLRPVIRAESQDAAVEVMQAGFAQQAERVQRGGRG